MRQIYYNFMILNEVDNLSRADMLGLTEEILNDPKIIATLLPTIEPNAKFISMRDFQDNNEIIKLWIEKKLQLKKFWKY